MSDDKDWKIMLKELQADLVTKDEQDWRGHERARRWQTKLLQIFNGEAANRILPPVTPKARKEFRLAVTHAKGLVDEIVEKISRKQLGFGELDMIDTTSRSLPWIDPVMARLLYPAGNAARIAMGLMAEENRLLHERWRNEITQKELAVFSAFLSQNPTVASVLWAAMTDKTGHIDDIGERLGRIITSNEIRYIADEANSMLRNVCPLGLVNISQPVRLELEDFPEELRRDEHHDFYCRLSGFSEPLDLIRKYGEPPAAAKPSASLA